MEENRFLPLWTPRWLQRCPWTPGPSSVAAALPWWVVGLRLWNWHSRFQWNTFPSHGKTRDIVKIGGILVCSWVFAEQSCTVCVVDVSHWVTSGPNQGAINAQTRPSSHLTINLWGPSLSWIILSNVPPWHFSVVNALHLHGVLRRLWPWPCKTTQVHNYEIITPRELHAVEPRWRFLWSAFISTQRSCRGVLRLVSIQQLHTDHESWSFHISQKKITCFLGIFFLVLRKQVLHIVIIEDAKIVSRTVAVSQRMSSYLEHTQIHT